MIKDKYLMWIIRILVVSLVTVSCYMVLGHVLEHPKSVAFVIFIIGVVLALIVITFEVCIVTPLIKLLASGKIKLLRDKEKELPSYAYETKPELPGGKKVNPNLRKTTTKKKSNSPKSKKLN